MAGLMGSKGELALTVEAHDRLDPTLICGLFPCLIFHLFFLERAVLAVHWTKVFLLPSLLQGRI